MARCPTCGSSALGIFKTIETRRCGNCRTVGCQDCGRSWIAFPYQYGVKKDKSGRLVPNMVRDYYCTPDCAINKLAQHHSLITRYGERSHYYALKSYPGTLHLFLFRGKQDENLLRKWMEQPLAQGIVRMRQGYRDLDYSEIMEGFKLARRDPYYPTFKSKLDAFAESYIHELKRFDVPTSTSQMGGVSITLSVPKGKSEMRIHSCPSCGATLDFIAIRGQVVNCQFCKSTFEIT
ncbi:MAG: hypothetical protein KAS60_03870 [Thermoplasmata archaeon]|nr:hypothetical protein [Thermoplasmata archaeon]